MLDLTKTEVELSQDIELHRIRLASWRVVYLVEEEWKLVSVLAIRKPPPYQYDDLDELMKNV